MRVLLISANTEVINMRALPWGLGCVTSATQCAGHKVTLLDLLMEGDPGAAVTEAIADFSPDVIGISVRNIDDQSRVSPSFLLERVKKVVDDCRRHSLAPVVLGGAGYSIFPESALEYLRADMGIQGEGEHAFPALLECLKTGASLEKVPGLYLRGAGCQGERKFVEDLDTLPLPGDDLLVPCSSSEEDPELDPRPERALIERLRQAVFTDTTQVEPQITALAALALHTDLLKNVFEKKNLKSRKKWIESLASGDVVGTVTKEAVRDVKVMVVISIITMITSLMSLVAAWD